MQGHVIRQGDDGRQGHFEVGRPNRHFGIHVHDGDLAAEDGLDGFLPTPQGQWQIGHGLIIGIQQQGRMSIQSANRCQLFLLVDEGRVIGVVVVLWLLWWLLVSLLQFVLSTLTTTFLFTQHSTRSVNVEFRHVFGQIVFRQGSGVACLLVLGLLFTFLFAFGQGRG